MIEVWSLTSVAPLHLHWPFIYTQARLHRLSANERRHVLLPDRTALHLKQQPNATREKNKQKPETAPDNSLPAGQKAAAFLALTAARAQRLALTAEC